MFYRFYICHNPSVLLSVAVEKVNILFSNKKGQVLSRPENGYAALTLSECSSINGIFAQSAGGGQVSSLCSKNNPRNINYMPAIIFFACLDLEQKSSFMDGH